MTIDMSWVITVVSLIVTTLISTIVSTAVKRGVDKKLDKSLSEQKEIEELRSEANRRQFNADVSTVMKEELAPLIVKINELSATLDLNKEGTIVLLREAMKQARDRFMEKGYASASEIASWHELYATYRKLGGNHFAEYVDEWKDDIDELPRSQHHEEETEI